MAVIGALRVDLAANIAKFEADMGKAAKQVAKVQRRFDQFGKRAMAAGQALSVGLTAPLVAVGALAARSFLSFEQGMNKVAAVSGATEAEMASLTTIAKDLGSTTSFSAAQAAEGLGFLAQAGFDATEAGKALPGVLQLAAAGGLQLAEAADIATNVLSGYGLEVDQLSRVNDVLAKASSSANTDVLQLGQAFKFAGPVARSAGISFEQSGAAMALMGNAGIQAEMAGTALRGAITKLVNPSKEAAGTMAELGISATDSEGRLRPLDEIIEQLAPHADNTGAIMQIFGQRAGPAMSALVSQGADALRDMTVALEQSGGTAQEIADKKLAGLTGAWTKLQSATEGVLIEIGSRLAPVLERIAAVLTDSVLPAVQGMLDAFGRLSPAAQANRLLWLGMAAAIGPALLAFGGIARAISPLVPAFSAVWMAAGRMSNALFQPVVTARKLTASLGSLRASLTGLSIGARASAVGVALGSKALIGLKFAVRGVIAALGPLALAFAAFEFVSWAAGALDLGTKLKRLVGITDDGAESARGADEAYEGLNQTLRERAVVEATAELADLQQQLAEQTERLETAEQTRNRRAIIRAKREIAALERKIFVQEGAIEVAQAAVESEQAAARASEEYTAALAAARVEAEGITDATGEQIRAARDLGVSLKDVSKKFGISTEALKIYIAELDAAGKTLTETAVVTADALKAIVEAEKQLGVNGNAALVTFRQNLQGFTASLPDDVLAPPPLPLRILQRHEAEMSTLGDDGGAAWHAAIKGYAATIPASDLRPPDVRFEQSGKDGGRILASNIVDTFRRAFEGGGGFWGGLRSLFVQGFADLFGGGGGLFSTIGGLFKGGGGKVAADFIGPPAPGGGGFLSGVFGKIQQGAGWLQNGITSAMNMVPVVGPLLAKFGPALLQGIGKLAGKVWSGIKRLFGGPSKEELARRDVFAEFHAGISADVKGMAEYQKVLQMHLSHGWDRTLAEVSAAFSAVGQSAGLSHDEAMAHYKTFQDAVKSGNKDQMLSVIAMYETWLEPISKSFKQYQQGCELHKAQEVIRIVLPARHNTALPLEPGKKALDLPPPRVAT